MRPHFCRLADILCNKFVKSNATAVRGFNQRYYHRIWRPRDTPLPSGCSQVSTQEKILNIQIRALSSVSQDDIEEDVDKKAAWWLKAFLFGTALYAGCYFLPLMGDSMIQQSVALLRVKDPLFKRMGASRLSRIAINDDRRRTIVEMGGIHGLVNMLNSAPDDLTRREAMKALASLSQSDVAVKALHQAGAQSVINSIADSTADDDILKYKSKLLRRLHELNFLKE
jgi:hypothetical protein